MERIRKHPDFAGLSDSLLIDFFRSGERIKNIRIRCRIRRMRVVGSLRTQTYFRLSLVSAAILGGDKRQPEIRLRSQAMWREAISEKKTEVTDSKISETRGGGLLLYLNFYTLTS